MSRFTQYHHVRVFDQSGAVLDINNLDREEWDEFVQSHSTDDLNFSVTQGPWRDRQKFIPRRAKPMTQTA